MKNKQWSCAEIQLTLVKALLEINRESNFQLLSDETTLNLYCIENELNQEIDEQGE